MIRVCVVWTDLKKFYSSSCSFFDIDDGLRITAAEQNRTEIVLLLEILRVLLQLVHRTKQEINHSSTARAY